MKKIALFYIFLFAQLFYWLSFKQISFPKIISDKVYLVDLTDLLNNMISLLPAFFQSLEIFFYVLIINVIFAIWISINLVKFNISQKLSALFYLPILAPLFLLAFGLYDIFAYLNLLGSKMGIVLAQSCVLFPFMLRPIEISLRQRDFNYEKIAFDLGESKLNTFYKVTIPLLYSPIKLGAFLTLIGSFNDYLLTLLIGDTLIETLPVKVLPMFLGDNRSLIALSIIFYLIPILVLTILHKEDQDIKYA